MNEATLLEASPETAHHFPTIGELVTNVRGVGPETPVKVVADAFFHDAQLDAVALVDGARPVGLVTRMKFLFTVFRQFGDPRMNRQRILIVDDDHAHLESTKGILEAEGYDVRTHDQPFGSTTAIMQYQPDLVLLDVNMPGLSGDKLADVYRANAKTRTARVMLYSSNDEDSLRAAARRLQLDGYICKGNPASLRLRVAAVLAR